MTARRTVLVLSDPHYAGPIEQGRPGHEAKAVSNPVLRRLLGAYRRHIWLRDPLAHNHLLDRFLATAPPADLVVGNGDYSCDTAFVGLLDDGAFESAAICIGRLRDRFGAALRLTYGDHELGKYSLFGGQGGMRLGSWRRAGAELGLEPCWQQTMGRHVLLGVVSSLVALPVYGPEGLPDEAPEWARLRREHLAEIASVFDRLQADQRLILFCHDPTALPYLQAEAAVRRKLPQIEATIVGHLHTPLVLWPSRLLAGMPRIGFLGNAVRRFSTALNQARHWRTFRMRLCPSLAGCQLRRDGGFLSLAIDPSAARPTAIRFHPLPWDPAPRP
ncbi:MAG: metallophosphoesterase [Verrucomicrobiae bacterium]|nr:metallophosphoesterase [Verrucomicrobiae bacterium]